jgi:hypothetical protein
LTRKKLQMVKLGYREENVEMERLRRPRSMNGGRRRPSVVAGIVIGRVLEEEASDEVREDVVDGVDDVFDVLGP